VKVVWITANKRIRGLVPIHRDCHHRRDKVNGSKVAYNGNTADIAKPQWKQWNIFLASFGVDLQNVTKLAIGFGDKTDLAPGGSGVV